MSKEIAQALASEGIRQGADPKLWYGALRQIPLRELSIEVLQDGQWKAVENMAQPS